jgi:small-conductance mechanosensitive channel
MPLLTPEQRLRFQELQEKQAHDGSLLVSEIAELTALEQQIDAGERQYLGPANERLRLESERLQGGNDVLRQIIARQEALKTRLQGVLAEVEAERSAIRRELLLALPELDTPRALKFEMHCASGTAFAAATVVCAKQMQERD